MSERLQKLLASNGHGSRREIEQWIRDGRVTIDGRVAQLGDRGSADTVVALDGRRLAVQPLSEAHGSAAQVLAYHKPVGEVTTRKDPEGRPTVFERLPPASVGRWVVVGRLDTNTSGLLLFTTDGQLAHQLMHPSTEVQREYLVRLRGAPSPAMLSRLQSGVMLEDGPAKFDKIEPSSEGGTPGLDTAHAWYRVTLHEGRNREVRRLWQAVGIEVSRLMRVRYGPVGLPRSVRPGGWWWLTPAEIAQLRASAQSLATRVGVWVLAMGLAAFGAETRPAAAAAADLSASAGPAVAASAAAAPAEGTVVGSGNNRVSISFEAGHSSKVMRLVARRCGGDLSSRGAADTVARELYGLPVDELRTWTFACRYKGKASALQIRGRVDDFGSVDLDLYVELQPLAAQMRRDLDRLLDSPGF